VSVLTRPVAWFSSCSVRLTVRGFSFFLFSGCVVACLASVCPACLCAILPAYSPIAIWLFVGAFLGGWQSGLWAVLA